MHRLTVDRWSRGQSLLHRRDPRGKILALFVFLVVVATARHGLAFLLPLLFLLLSAAFLAARVPLTAALLRAAVVLPFTIVFAWISWYAGDPRLGILLAAKSYLSALAVLLLVATTGVPSLFNGLAAIGLPRFLLLVAQFLYRYSFVISEEARYMGKAAAARGASLKYRVPSSLGFRAAAGAVAVLFARSYARAESIHQAMLARGFYGRFQSLDAPSFRMADAWFAGLASLGPVLLRFAVERVVR